MLENFLIKILTRGKVYLDHMMHDLKRQCLTVILMELVLL